MKARLNSRKLRLESLEERTLLAVTAGVTEQAAEIAAPTGAENWIVNTTADPSSWDADDTIISLREAIARAAAGDTVTFAPSLAGGTITLNGTELEITKGMTIDAASIGGMTINADGKSRVFNVSGGNSSNSVELISLTISGGSTDDGGGIINSGSLKLTGSTVTNNSATRYGGGIYNSGTLNVASSTISGNSSEDVGGGIFNSGTLNVASSTISDNSSEDSGGGIYNSGTLNVASSTISDNSSEDSGGGIFNFGTLNVTNSTVSGNVAIYIYEYNGKVWQYGEGGGIYSDYDSTLTVINSAIFGNTAGSYGGGVYWYASSTGTSVTIINTTISGNSVLREDGCGGGIYAGDYDAEPTLINTIVSFNYSSFDSNFCGLYSGNNNIIGLDPGFVAAPLFDESGTLVNLNGIDLTLTASSYAIDHGTNDVVETDTDLAGNPRTFAAWKGTPTVDIGAYEYQRHIDRGEPETPSTVVTTSLDILDEFDGLVSLREAISYAETGGTITFDTSLADKTITLAGAELTIDKSLTIDASGIGGISIDGSEKGRVFNICGDPADVTVDLIGLTIRGGRAENGGGIYNSGTLNVASSTISGNSSEDSGGGIYNSGTLNVASSTISGNSTEDSGGGIYNSGTLNVTNSTLSGNSAFYIEEYDGEVWQYGEGGGIYSDYDATLTVINSAIFGNTAHLYGGGIYWHVSSTEALVTIINTTISGNSVLREDGCGGGIYAGDYDAEPTLINTIVSFNYSSFDSNFCGLYSGNNNIIGLDPGFVAAPLFDESGTLVNLNEIDLTLTASSYAIDHGTNDSVETDTDLAGNPRTFAAWKVTPTVDIGAYEYQQGVEKGETETPSTVVTTPLDILDEFDGLVSLREAISYAETGGTITFDTSLANKTITLAGAELTIDKSLTIDASSIGGISIDGNGKSRIIFINGESGDVTVELTALSIKNGCGENGGGIFNDEGTLKISNSAVSGNHASWRGGGISNDGALTLINTVISGNSAGSHGGGIFNDGDLIVTNTTVSGNYVLSEYGDGGGISSYNNDCTMTLTNSIVSFNYAAFNSAVEDNDISGSYSGSNNIICLDPGFVVAPVFKWGKIANFAEMDLSLIDGARAVNAGANDAVETEFDIAGNPRIVDGTVDIGAYEFQGNNETPSTVVTTLSDVVDVTDHLISLREAISYAESGDTVTFDASLAGKTITLGGSELEISKGMTIDASPIGGITVNAGGASRVFSVTGGDSSRSVELIGLTISGGNADLGGGIFNSGSLKLTGSTVTNNSSTRYGGGIYNSGALKFTRCFVTNNSSVRYGGGIANTKSLTVIDSVISANSASSSYGGGIFNTDTLTLTGSTVSGNSAKTGGGIYRSSGTIELTNTIVSFNYAPSNNDFRGTYTGSHNIVGDNPGFAAAPVFADGVLTNPDTLDLSLAAGSAAINAGTNAAVTTETDVAGNPRIVDGTVDIGAYEFQRNNETPSTVVTTLSDVVDVTDGLISLREAISYAESGGTVTFDASLAGGTITLNGTELEITKGMTIDAASIGGMTINADGKSRVFSVTVRDSSRSVELIGLTVTGGNFSNGSGIYNHGTLTITNSTISGNTASYGGGIYHYSGTLTITNSTISGNTASNDGGGIFNGYNDEGTLTITNSTISGNTASVGGGIYNRGTLTITNSTISGNTASYGGGINNFNNWGTVKLTNTIVSLNYAGYSYNDVYDSYSGSNNIVGDDPGFVIAPVFDESGILTNADTLDLSLAVGSAAINAGTNDAVTTEYDIAGNPRIVGGVVDIGAYEYVGSMTPLGAPVITSGSRGIYISYGANRHYLQWGAVAGASGYEVQYSTGGATWTSVSTTGTGAVIRGLTYGADVTYRVRALGAGSYTDSAWSGTKTFNVCPMDVNGDGDISGGDRSIVALMWLAEKGDDNYQNYADINGDGEISNPDRPFIGSNWSKEAGDADLVYPRALGAAEAAFAEYGSAKPDNGLDIF